MCIWATITFLGDRVQGPNWLHIKKDRNTHRTHYQSIPNRKAKLADARCIPLMTKFVCQLVLFC